jgi:thiosulfate dehydrogenase
MDKTEETTRTALPMTTLAVVVFAAFGAWAGLRGPTQAAPQVELAMVTDAAAPTRPATWPLRAPDPATIPDTPLGAAVRRGLQLATHTNQELPEHVGGALTCASCHRGGGTVAHAGPWVGVVGMFPEYRPRSGDVDTLEERINDCFERSMNGRAIDAEGAEMAALVAYMTWLSEDVPIGVPVEGRGFARVPPPPVPPDREHGRALYGERCASCHGADGAGSVAADGAITFPPLWGPRSFNIGAGMARIETAAAFVHDNMPLGQGGTLSTSDAYDLAAFFTTQPRPDFAYKVADWPNGGKPRDARY